MKPGLCCEDNRDKLTGCKLTDSMEKKGFLPRCHSSIMEDRMIYAVSRETPAILTPPALL
jgi:hypothetical protein